MTYPQFISERLHSVSTFLMKYRLPRTFLVWFLMGVALLHSSPTHAASLIPTASSWRWLPGTNEASTPLSAWRQVGYDDARFVSAPAPFWYGDVLPGGTLISGMQNVYLCVFLRKTFVVDDPSQVGGLQLGALVDDGFVAWINGTEVSRVNMSGASGTDVSIATTALNAAEPVPFKIYDLPPPGGYLRKGTNVLAVQVFQSSIGSSDLGFECSLDSILTETIPPRVESVTPAAGTTLNSLSQITVTFTEPVTGVTAAHLLVSGIPATSVSTPDSKAYTFSFQQPLYGSVSVGWNPQHGITDLALPPNRFDESGPGASWSYSLVDITAPTVSSISPIPGSTVRSLNRVTVLFSEPVTGVDAADLLINGNPASVLIPESTSQYTFSFMEPSTGLVRMAWAPAAGIRDLSIAANAFNGGAWSNRLDPNALEAPPYISEVMSSNTRTLADETGAFSDWVEIYNPAVTPLNLEGWYLTDSASDLKKWRLPATNIAAGRFLVVFASGNDRRLPGATLHANFQLSASGEYLGLVRPDGVTVASEYRPSLPQQLPDVSYGVIQLPAGQGLAAGESGVYFTTPTPGAANLGGTAVPGPVIENVTHSPQVPRDTDDLVVTATVRASLKPVASVALRYRIQFGGEVTIPMLDDGAHGDGAAGDGRYGAIIPATLSTNGQMIRYWVGATDSNARTSRWPLYTDPLTTEQYLGTVVEPVPVSSRLPVFYLFVDPSQLAGIDTESGGRVAVFYDGEFYDNVYMELRGNTSAGLVKKSHRLEFIRGHEFRHAGPGGRSRRSALLAEYLDPAYLRQHLSFWFLDNIGVPSPYHYPVHVEMNGQFYQLAFHNDVIGQEQMERMGYDPRGALYKAVGTFTPDFYSTGVFQKLEPDSDPSRTDYLSLANGINESSSALVRKRTVFDQLDVAQVINHLAGTRWCAENDDVWANMSMYRDTFGDGLWRNIPFDMNASWGQLYGGSSPLEATVDNSKSHPLYGGSSTSGTFNRLYDVIVQLPETRAMLLRRERSILDAMVQPPGTPASALIIENHIRFMTNLIAPDAALDRAKWGFSPWAPGKTFSAGVGDLLDQFVALRRRHWYVTHSITNTSRPIGILPSNNAGIPLAQPYDAGVVIASVESNPASKNQFEEFVCLSNTMPYAVDLSGWTLGGGVDFKFQPGTVLTSNGVIYVSPHTPSFRARTTGPRGGQGLFAVGPYQGQLSARGETLTLETQRGQRVSTFTYEGNPGAAQQFLRVTEIQYHPAPVVGNGIDAEEFEFIELRNISTSVSLNLSGVRFVEGVLFDFTGSAVTQLAPGQRVLVVRNSGAFVSRYGNGLPVAGNFVGSLDNAGERLRLVDGNSEEILDFEYRDGWYAVTDGLGFSLRVVDETAEPDAWSRKAQWVPSARVGGSPGKDEGSYVAVPGVLVNEALTRGDQPPLIDAVELYNPEPNPADISGWWLTDDLNTPAKYRFPAGTVIPARGFLTVDENSFNLPPAPFSLSSDGDEIWLLSADASGALTGYLHGFRYGAADDGVSFGRHSTSDGRELFVAQSTRTLGAINAGPRVGPVVIQEIQYRPIDNPDGSDNNQDEFVELKNITTLEVPLYDLATNTWRLRGQVDFDFPNGTRLSPAETILLVSFDPTNTVAAAAFRSRYALGGGVRLFGPYAHNLDNSGGVVELRAPGRIAQFGTPYYVVDRVEYSDRSPWPGGADGYGLSLQRVSPTLYGDDPNHWVAAPPTPGAATRAPELPVIVQQPVGRNTAPGAAVQLSVGALGADLRYQWRVNGDSLSGATNSVLNLSPIQLDQLGTYTVMVYTASGSALSAPARIVMTQPTQILTQPRSAAISPGSGLTLTVVARSPWGLRYQWRFNGQDMPGKTSASLSLVNAQRTDQGDYSVVVSDDLGSIVSAVASVTVVVEPRFVVQPLSQSVVSGGTLVLSAAVTNQATLPLGFRVQRGTNIVSDPAVSIFRPDPFTVFVRMEGTNAAPPWTNYALVATNAAAPLGISSEIARIQYLDDVDKDGMVDGWEIEQLGGIAATPSEDLDGDRLNNYSEFIAGTDPRNPASLLSLKASAGLEGAVLQFQGVSNRTYTVQFTDGLSPVQWQALQHRTASPTNRVEQVVDPTPTSHRLYRVVTPFKP